MTRFIILALALAVATGLACVCFAGERRTADHAPPELADPVHADADVEELMRLFREKNDAGTLFMTREKWPREMDLRITGGPGVYRLPETRSPYHIQFADCHQEKILQYTWLHNHIHGDPFGQRSIVWCDRTIGIPPTCIDDTGEVQMLVRIASVAVGDLLSDFEPISFDVELVDTVDDILQPVTDEALTSRLAEHILVTLTWRRTARDEQAFLLVYFPVDIPNDLILAFNLELTFENDNNVLASSRFTTNRWFRRTLERSAASGMTERITVLELDTDLPYADFIEDAAGRSVRAKFTSDPEFALRDFENTRYWHGSFTTDVTVSGWDD